jgi:hypothetical protein
MKHALDIGAKGPVYFIGRKVPQLLVCSLHCGVVDQDIDSTEFGDGPRDYLAAMTLLANVPGHEHGLLAGLPDPTRRFLGILVFVQVSNQYISALSRKGDRDGTSDSRVAAGDYRAAALEPCMATVALLTVIRNGIQLRGLARCGLLLLWKRRPGPGRAGINEHV